MIYTDGVHLLSRRIKARALRAGAKMVDKKALVRIMRNGENA